MGDRYYSSNPADRAKDILNHYFKLVMEKSSLKYDSDTQAELDQVIDDIIEASKPDEPTESMRQYYLRKPQKDNKNE